MSRQLFANEKVMKQYLTALLNDDEVSQLSSNLDPVAKLLQQVQPIATEPKVSSKKITEKAEKVIVINEQQNQPITDTELQIQAAVPPIKRYDDEYRQGEFQALFFNVAGLTLAVPLKSLGGIHQVGE